jgi:hypothetical protein
MGVNKDSSKRAWTDDEMRAITLHLRSIGVYCLSCADYHYPDVFVLVASDITDKLVRVMSSWDVRYRVIVIDMESSVQDQSIHMVREICDPFVSYTRAPAA